MNKSPQSPTSDHLLLGFLPQPHSAGVIQLPNLEATALHGWLRKLRTQWREEGRPLRLALVADPWLDNDTRLLTILNKAIRMTGFEWVGVLGEQAPTWSQVVGIEQIQEKPEFNAIVSAVFQRNASVALYNDKVQAVADLARQFQEANISNTKAGELALAVLENKAAGDRLFTELNVEADLSVVQTIEKTSVPGPEAVLYPENDEDIESVERFWVDSQTLDAKTEAQQGPDLSDGVAQSQVEDEHIVSEPQDTQPALVAEPTEDSEHCAGDERDPQEQHEEQPIPEHDQAELVPVQDQSPSPDEMDQLLVVVHEQTQESAEQEVVEATVGDKVQAPNLGELGQEAGQEQQPSVASFDDSQARDVIEEIRQRRNSIVDLHSAELEVVARPRSALVAPKRVSGIVRTGTVIEHDGDIIIEGSVHDGAEVRAGGDIHVYGRAGGRLFAGCGGNTVACLYINHFDAEIVAVADEVRVFEEIPANWESASIKIQKDPVSGKLRFFPLAQQANNVRRAAISQP